MVPSSFKMLPCSPCPFNPLCYESTPVFGDILTSCFLTCTKVVPFFSWAAADRAAPVLQKPRGVRSGPVVRSATSCNVPHGAGPAAGNVVRGWSSTVLHACPAGCSEPGRLGPGTCRSEGCRFRAGWVTCRAGRWSCCVKVIFFSRRLSGCLYFYLL